MQFTNAWVYDSEIYPNLFTLVARKLDSSEYVKFVIHKDRDDRAALFDWLNTMPILIGYNNIPFDGQILNHLWVNRKMTPLEIYEWKENLMTLTETNKFNLPYSEYKMVWREIDLMRINHYDAKKISLKWLEFSTRASKMADLPFPHDRDITKSNIPKVLTYNRVDVDRTYEFLYKCEPMIDLRVDLARTYNNPRVINMSDSSIGQYIFKHSIAKREGKSINSYRKGTNRSQIRVADVLLDYVEFQSDVFNNVLDTYRDMVIPVEEGRDSLKSAFNQKVEFDGMEFTFGTGGIHAFYKAGAYRPKEGETLLSIDVRSYYPFLGITNGFHPHHIAADVFTTVYRALYDERGRHDKGTALNYAIKIALNSVYGKSNSKYSFLYDPQYTVAITVNGQLLLTMLAEVLAEKGRLLMVNTDGLEIMVPNENLDAVLETCEMWETVTGLMLEHDRYDLLAVKDVNNYIAINEKGEAKRKGAYLVYEDYTEEGGKPHSYHKNPSATIVPQAVFNYYKDGTPVEDTVNNCNNIYEFLYGLKGGRKFSIWFLKADPSGVVEIEQNDDRALRYYIAEGGSNMFKFWKDGRKNNLISVNKGQLVSLALNVKDERIVGDIASGKYKGNPLTEYQDLNKNHYIYEAYKLIHAIEHPDEGKPTAVLLDVTEEE